MQSNYELDLAVEAELSKYIDKYVYPELTRNIPGFQFQGRNTDMALQRKGVDVYAGYNGQNATIDEKASTDWMDSGMKTFALELHYFLRGGQKVGWLLDESKINDLYLIVSRIRTIRPNQYGHEDKAVKRQFLANFQESHIIDLEVLLVQKSRLWQYLDSKGMNKEYLKSVVSWVSGGNYAPSNLPDGMKFRVPATMEGGLSLLLPLSTWHNVSDKHLLVSRNPLNRQVIK